MMNREQTYNALKERLVSRAKEGRMHCIDQVLAYATGYMPELTLGEFDKLVEIMKNEYNIIF